MTAAPAPESAAPGPLGGRAVLRMIEPDIEPDGGIGQEETYEPLRTKRNAIMLLTFFVAICAGAAVMSLQPRVTELLWQWLGERHLPDEAGRRVISFAIALAIAVAILWLLNVRASPMALLAGGLVGHFQQPLREIILARRK
ncbi:hypothetical protein SAMN05421759_10645 [Roseivivax lentus]|uniref:Uncharacterized protein n=1 Tax=Roseivivax lentus TaxID=633194 RepID=A0A1N7MYW2_9RHOB|nr:hypothetical protein [Roseivivax lentus]SIS91069.1 hypothetical protein SAMN05421759_10645 [Roseivivax lentus]